MIPCEGCVSTSTEFPYFTAKEAQKRQTSVEHLEWQSEWGLSQPIIGQESAYYPEQVASPALSITLQWNDCCPLKNCLGYFSI